MMLSIINALQAGVRTLDLLQVTFCCAFILYDISPTACQRSSKMFYKSDSIYFNHDIFGFKHNILSFELYLNHVDFYNLRSL